MRVLLLILCLASGAHVVRAPGQSENRLWWADFDLRGPLAALRVDCGEDGSVHLDARLLSGETRRVSLPLPVRSPLGVEGLGAVPTPRIEVPDASAGSARFLSWSTPQPDRRYQGLGPALRARTRPPASEPRSAAGPAQLALLCATGCLLWALRRRALWLLPLSLLAALALFFLAGRQSDSTGVTEVLDVAADAPAACLQRAAVGTLELPTAHLEVLPAGRRLHFRLTLEGTRIQGTVEAPAATLVGMDVRRARPWSPALPPPEPLAAVWFRSAAGTWAPSFPWPDALPALSGAAAGAPPGWLATGLPPGRTLLLGQSAGDPERWIRISGFPAP